MLSRIDDLLSAWELLAILVGIYIVCVLIEALLDGGLKDVFHKPRKEKS